MAKRTRRLGRDIPLAELIEHLRKLDAARGIERVQLARWLSSMEGPTYATLQAAGDEGVVEALADTRLSAAALAVELGHPYRAAVTDAVLRHRDRLALRG
jgi:hypothetical protein